MILLRLISWPYVRKHLLRSVLTTAGIVLGVALLVGMQTANRSVLRAFNQTVDRIAGKAQLQVSAGDSGFAEEVLERLQSLPEVRAAAPVIESSVDPGLKGQGKLLILAVDLTGDRTLRDYDFDSGEQDVIDDPLVFLAQPDSLIVTREFADRNGLRSGSKLTFDTMEGRKQFTVRGILKAGGMAQAFGGNLGIMDIYAAQKFFGRGRRFDRRSGRRAVGRRGSPRPVEAQVGDGVALAANSVARAEEKAEARSEVEGAPQVGDREAAFAFRIGALSEDLAAEGQSLAKVPLQQPAGERVAPLPGSVVDGPAAAAVGGPRAPALLDPKRDPEPRAAVAEAARGVPGRQLDHRKDPNLGSVLGLLEKAKLETQLHVTQPGLRPASERLAPRPRHDQVELEVRGRAQVELDGGALDLPGG